MTITLNSPIPFTTLIAGSAIGRYFGQVAAVATGHEDEADKWAARGEIIGGTVGLALPVVRDLARIHTGTLLFATRRH